MIRHQHVIGACGRRFLALKGVLVLWASASATSGPSLAGRYVPPAEGDWRGRLRVSRLHRAKVGQPGGRQGPDLL